MRRYIALTLGMAAWAGTALGQPVPPPGSPAAMGQRPRMLVTQANQVAVRDYVLTHYRADFQQLINCFDDPEPERCGSKTGTPVQIFSPWAPANFAFPVALGGVEVLSAAPYNLTFPATHNTNAKLCQAAYTAATTDVTRGTSICTPGSPCRSGVTWLNKTDLVDANLSNNSGSSWYFMSATTGVYYLPTILMYDWCHAELSSVQKSVIAEAHWTSYLTKWAGQNLLTRRFFNTPQTLNNRWQPAMDDTLFALAVWGDNDVLDGTRRQTLYETFHTLWVDRFLWEVDKVAPNGWIWPEGSNYWSYSGGVLFPPPMAAIDTALGTSYAADRAYFTTSGQHQVAWRWPENQGKTAGCGEYGSKACPGYTESWGDNTYKVGFAGCATDLMTVGFARFMALSQPSVSDVWRRDAESGRFGYDNFTSNWLNCSSAFLAVPWATDLYFKYLFGVAGTTPVAPATRNHILGEGDYIFRGSYTADDTYVWFNAQPMTYNAHETYDIGTFSIRKFGALAVNAVSHRTGVCSVTIPDDIRRSVIKNNVGIHKGVSDPNLGFDRWTADPEYVARGITGQQYRVALPPRHSFGDSYSYVHHDQSPGWSVASTMQREFVYLRGPLDHEYIVILDRADVANPVNEPIWKLWVAAQPACHGAACVNTAPGEWSTSAKTVSVTNAHGPMPEFGDVLHSPDRVLLGTTHGKMFVRSLLPADARVSLLGDDGSMSLMYRDGNRAVMPWKSAGCTVGNYETFGWGRIEIQPGAVKDRNLFLNVIQVGDAASLESMSPTDVVDSLDGGFVVGRIADGQRNRVVAFAKTVALGTAASSLRYGYVATTATSDHLILNLAPSTPFYIATTGTGTLTVEVSRTPNGGMAGATDSAGALSFQLAGTTVIVPPRAPLNLRKLP